MSIDPNSSRVAEQQTYSATKRFRGMEDSGALNENLDSSCLFVALVARRPDQIMTDVVSRFERQVHDPAVVFANGAFYRDPLLHISFDSLLEVSHALPILPSVLLKRMQSRDLSCGMIAIDNLRNVVGREMPFSLGDATPPLEFEIALERTASVDYNCFSPVSYRYQSGLEMIGWNVIDEIGRLLRMIDEINTKREGLFFNKNFGRRERYLLIWKLKDIQYWTFINDQAFALNNGVDVTQTCAAPNAQAVQTMIETETDTKEDEMVVELSKGIESMEISPTDTDVDWNFS